MLTYGVAKLITEALRQFEKDREEYEMTHDIEKGHIDGIRDQTMIVARSNTSGSDSVTKFGRSYI